MYTLNQHSELFFNQVLPIELLYKVKLRHYCVPILGYISYKPKFMTANDMDLTQPSEKYLLTPPQTSTSFSLS